MVAEEFIKDELLLYMCVHRDHHQRLPLEMLVGVELLEVAQGLLKEVVLVLKVRQDL